MPAGRAQNAPAERPLLPLGGRLRSPDSAALPAPARWCRRVNRFGSVDTGLASSEPKTTTRGATGLVDAVVVSAPAGLLPVRRSLTWAPFTRPPQLIPLVCHSRSRPWPAATDEFDTAVSSQP